MEFLLPWNVTLWPPAHGPCGDGTGLSSQRRRSKKAEEALEGSDKAEPSDTKSGRKKSPKLPKKQSESAAPSAVAGPNPDAPDPEPPEDDSEEQHAGKERSRTGRTYAREAGALVLIASGMYTALAMGSYRADPLRPEVVGSNWVGPVGEALAGGLVAVIGIVAWLLPLELMLLSGPLMRDRKFTLRWRRFAGDLSIAAILAALVHIAMPQATAFGNMPLAGAVGDLGGNVLRGLFSTAGSFLIGLTLVGLILVGRSNYSFIEMVVRAQALISRFGEHGGSWMARLASAWTRAREAEAERRAEQEKEAVPIIASSEQADAIIAAFAEDFDEGVRLDELAAAPQETEPAAPPSVAVTEHRITRPDRISTATPTDASSLQAATLFQEAVTPSLQAAVVAATTAKASAKPSTKAKPAKAKASAKAKSAKAKTPTPEPAVVEAPVAEAEATVAPPIVLDDPETKQRSTPAKTNSKPEESETAEEQELRIVDTSHAAKTKKCRSKKKPKKVAFELPGSELLEQPASRIGGLSEEQLRATAALLEKTLADYKVEGKVREIHPGPTVTMFEVSPAPGTKVSKVAGLADDLALGLSRKVRIVAPIPGKNRIGFEVPNEKRLPVNLRELVESQDYMDMKAHLPCVLGRDIIGRPFFADMAAMPHVIVAGATGAGKSVGLNVMLVSLLYRCTPEELRILMIDPKVVELAPFDKIPHLLFPVVTDMKQASNALKWTVDEMERRYQLFADAGTRNIITYNDYVKAFAAGEAEPPPPPKTVEAVAPDGTQVEIPGLKDGSDTPLPIKLPYIVVVIEEFADLMMTQGKAVEASVARLAQKARAAGIHVILATQRPSVDVITGMIKANFPTRIAYRVSQKVDSRTILDQQGAEHLLGRGDMLVKLNGTSDVIRVQCPFVSEGEVQAVTDMLRAQGEPDYDESIVKGGEDENDAEPGDADRDPLFDKAVQIVAESKKCSTSWIQRKLGVGYNRAAKIVETMEKHGIVGPPNGSKPREILISAH